MTTGQSLVAPVASPNLDAVDPLEQLLAESKAEFSLEGLLAESMQQKHKADAAKDARQRLAKGGVDKKTRAQLEALVTEHEMKVMWKVEAGVVMIHRQWCNGCDCCHNQFRGYFQRQKHRHSKIDRWIKTDKQNLDGLVKEVKYEDEIVDTCEECAALAGFPIDDYAAINQEGEQE